MELYKFNITSDETEEQFFYTNNLKNYILQKYDSDGSSYIEEYTSSYIEREEISLKVDSDLLKIKVDCNLEPFSRINDFILNKKLEIEVIDTEKGIKFKGYAVNYEIDVVKKYFTIHFNNLTNLLQVNCPTRTFSRSCPFSLYDNKCSLNKENFFKTITFRPFYNVNFLNDIDETRKKIYTTSLDTSEISVYSHGIIDFNNGEQSIHILSNDEDDDGHYIELLFPIALDLENIKLTKIYKGCNKNTADCENKFNNLINFGGFPYIPSQNLTQGF